MVKLTATEIQPLVPLVGCREAAIKFPNEIIYASMRWLLFEYEGLELVILSKPFKTKKLAEKGLTDSDFRFHP